MELRCFLPWFYIFLKDVEGNSNLIPEVCLGALYLAGTDTDRKS